MKRFGWTTLLLIAALSMTGCPASDSGNEPTEPASDGAVDEPTTPPSDATAEPESDAADSVAPDALDETAIPADADGAKVAGAIGSALLKGLTGASGSEPAEEAPVFP